MATNRWRHTRGDNDRVCRCLACLLLALLLTGGSTGPHKGQWGSSMHIRDDACAIVAVRGTCKAIQVGTRIQRYSLLRAGNPTAETAIIDLGGPGGSVLAQGDNAARFRTAHPGLGDRFNLLFLEEPWVINSVGDSCDAALRTYYRTVRNRPERGASAGTRLVHDCDLGQAHGHWGFSPNFYPVFLTEIERRESLRVNAFAGFSFGSVRLSYLSGRSFDWVVLARPFPVGVTGTALVEARSRLLNRLSIDVLPGRKAVGLSRGTASSRFDSYSALIELGYLDDDRLTDVAARFGGEVTHNLSHQLWQRYGQDSVSPGILAIFDETCQVLGPWPRPLKRMTSVADALAAWHLPCRPARRQVPRLPHMARFCVVTSPTDSVTPQNLVRQQFEDRKAVWVVSHRRSHHSMDRVDECFESIGVRGAS
ncbi:hypothetical protein ETD83_34180 [Actinomadura soli]|uniref:Alpha/beta hydrolase n=1 Tax=Actinomadura soli TaxID=2508997 RepID=A0A5C4J1U8_9ACTN|nr:hypothetical protein [Actinomadura soli]TMQ90716.1 hypothetical protein ETD83_34180 [Actinomadura soli]